MSYVTQCPACNAHGSLFVRKLVVHFDNLPLRPNGFDAQDCEGRYEKEAEVRCGECNNLFWLPELEVLPDALAS